MSLPLTAETLERIAIIRLEEAEHLFDAGHFCGAYYLAGYAAELALKVCIANAFQPRRIPDKNFVNDIYTHKLPDLVKLAGLKADLEAMRKEDAIFAQNWELVREWSESSRYDIIEGAAAQGLLNALRDPEHGVFEWIRSHW